MKVKLATLAAGAAQEVLDIHASALYSTLGAHRVAVIEFASVERTQMAPDEDKEATVTVRIQSMEIADDKQADPLRKALAALHLQRTAHGTLTEDGDVKMSTNVIEGCAGDVNLTAAVRMQIATEQLRDHATRALFKGNAADMRKALEAIKAGMTRVLTHQDAFDETTDRILESAGQSITDREVERTGIPLDAPLSTE